MKEYLPILERLIYCVAFFLLGWFFKGLSYKPSYERNDVEVIYKKDTVFVNSILKNKEIIYKYITKVDSFKFIDTTTNEIKDQIIKTQDTIIFFQNNMIDTLVNTNSNLKLQLDTCATKNDLLLIINDKQQKKIKRRNTFIITSFAVISSFITGVFIK